MIDIKYITISLVLTLFCSCSALVYGNYHVPDQSLPGLVNTRSETNSSMVYHWDSHPGGDVLKFTEAGYDFKLNTVNFFNRIIGTGPLFLPLIPFILIEPLFERPEFDFFEVNLTIQSSAATDSIALYPDRTKILIDDREYTP